MKKAIIISLLMFSAIMIPPRAEAQFNPVTRVTQFLCSVSSFTPTLCVDLSSAPYSGNVFGSFVIYGDTTTTNATLRVDSSSLTVAAAGVPVTSDGIRWFSYDQAQLIYKGQIWSIAQGTTTSVNLIIGIARPAF